MVNLKLNLNKFWRIELFQTIIYHFYNDKKA